MFRQITGIACPSCGTTRSVIALLHLQIGQAFQANPFGFIVISIMLISPIWIIKDLISRSDSFFNWYRKAEIYLIQHKILSLFLGVLVLINWVWNISKYYNE